MSRKLVLAMLLMIVIVSLLSVEKTFAQRTVGVGVGYSIEGSCVFSGNTTTPPDPSTIPSWLRVTVQEISGTNIIFHQRTRYWDTHEDTGIYLIDVETGQGNASGSFIAANLNEGDLIYTDPPAGQFQGATINETVLREYLGSIIEVNHYNYTMTQTVPEGTYTSSMNYYWNRTTGAAVEMSMYQCFKPTGEDAEWGEWRWEMIGLGKVFHVVVDSVDYAVSVISNSTITEFGFSQVGKKISFHATGIPDDTGYCNVTIPANLLWGEFIVYKDGTPLIKDVDYTQTYNGTHYAFYITYIHSNHLIEIEGAEVIPEFPPFLTVPLFMILTLLAMIISKRIRIPSNPKKH